MNSFMKIAALEAARGCQANEGGPFGAVISRNGIIIAQGHNEVLLTNDPTAHAEMVAIRLAAAALGRFDLSACELYTSCEPCPMCLSAIYWARISQVYYGCTKEDAADIGFADNAIYEYIKRPEQHQNELRLTPLDREECLPNFIEWQKKQDKTPY
jgi:guanine deaminase